MFESFMELFGGGKKYELLFDDSIVKDDRVLYRVRALRAFGGVPAGAQGGYVESERNLSHRGLCWVADGARVYEDARVSGDAVVEGAAVVHEQARVSDRARVFGYARVSGRCDVSGTLQLGLGVHRK